MHQIKLDNYTTKSGAFLCCDSVEINSLKTPRVLNMGSYTPPEDLKARFQGSEAARRSKKTIDNRFPLSVTEPKREGGVGIFSFAEIHVFNI